MFKSLSYSWIARCVRAEGLDGLLEPAVAATTDIPAGMSHTKNGLRILPAISAIDTGLTAFQALVFLAEGLRGENLRVSESSYGAAF